MMIGYGAKKALSQKWTNRILWTILATKKMAVVAQQKANVEDEHGHCKLHIAGQSMDSRREIDAA